MTTPDQVQVSQLCMQLAQAERVLQSLIDNDTPNEDLREALEYLHIAKINIDSFIRDST